MTKTYQRVVSSSCQLLPQSGVEALHQICLHGVHLAKTLRNCQKDTPKNRKKQMTLHL